MISAFFQFIGSLLSLTEHATKSVNAKFEEAKPSIKDKLNRASADIRSKCGTD